MVFYKFWNLIDNYLNIYINIKKSIYLGNIIDSQILYLFYLEIILKFDFNYFIWYFWFNNNYNC